MAETYRTIQGDMIDAICRRFYGDESTYVEMVVEANPGLAALAEPLPAGLTVVLPDAPKASPSDAVVTLWD